MADPAVFDELMPHSINVGINSGFDKYGKRTAPTTWETYRCLYDDSVQIIDGMDNQTVQINRTCYINTLGADITDDMLFEFQDGSTREVVSISRHYDTDGSIHSVTVAFQ